MKTASYLRIFIASLTMTAISWSDPIDESTNPPGGGLNVQTSHGEYHTGVMTWVRNDGGNLIGLVTETPDTDLSTVDVFVVKQGQRISVHNQFDHYSMLAAHDTYGEYFWASSRNSVLMLNYIGKTADSEPPYPLEVIIVY